MLVLSGRGGEVEIRHALQRGARGYLLGPCSLDELVAAVRSVGSGRRYLCAAAARRVAQSLTCTPLTPRETEVLRLMALGLPNKRIASRLAIALGTVKAHIQAILAKLDARSRTEATVHRRPAWPARAAPGARRLNASRHPNRRRRGIPRSPTMSTFTTKDGTQIYYKDWGSGPVVSFSHGWPLSADAWEAQMFFLASNGFRCIAHDRRGHGRSSQPWDGNDMDTYADDLAELFTALDLKDATMIGHSTGGGEVARYIGRHGTKRVAQGGADGRGAADHAEDRGQSRRPADGGVRRLPQGLPRRPRAVLPGCRQRPLLRLQPARREGLAGADPDRGGCRG